MTAIRKRGESLEVLHGYAAVRARKRNPGDWEIFAYPKLVFVDETTTSDVQRTLDLQKDKAKAFGMISKEVAVAFFRHMINEVIGQSDEVFKIYINISDRWRNSNVQELMLSLNLSIAQYLGYLNHGRYETDTRCLEKHEQQSVLFSSQ